MDKPGTYRILRCCLISLAIALPVSLAAQAQTPAQPLDVVIVHGHIVDGTGSPWYSGDVGIRDGRIAAIGNLADAPRKRTIDAARQSRRARIH